LSVIKMVMSDADRDVVNLLHDGSETKIDIVQANLNNCGLCFKIVNLTEQHLEGVKSGQKYHMDCDPRKAKENPPDPAKCGVCGEIITDPQNLLESKNPPIGDSSSSSDPSLRIRKTARYIRERKQPPSDFIEEWFVTEANGMHHMIKGVLKGETNRTKDGRLVLTIQSILHPISEESTLGSPLPVK